MVGRKRQALLWGVVLALAALGAWLVLSRTPLTAWFASRGDIATALRGAGAWGPLAVIGLSVAQIIAAPLPGQAVNMAAGYLYGFWLGLLYSWIGSVVGSALAMGLARVAGRPLLNRFLDRSSLERLDRLAAGKGLRFFFLVFLLPFLPDDLACYLGGLTSLPLPALLALAAVGRLPGLVAAVWAGTQAVRLQGRDWLLMAAVAVPLLAVVWRFGPRVQAALLGYLSRKT